MPLSFFARKLGLCLGLVLATPLLVFGQAGFVPEGGEYPIAGSLAGDQVLPALALDASGGYLVWEDNITDGSGQGISARKIDSSLSGSLSVFRVNSQSGGDQQKPKVALLDNGGAVFVWQGGARSAQQIYARFISPSTNWIIADDVLVNTYTNSAHLDAAVTTLTDGTVVVVWSSFNQDGSYQGVYGQRFSPTGNRLGVEFRVNTTTALNQRTPVVAGLSDGNFIVVWVSEKQMSELSYDVSIFARRFNASGSAVDQTEFQVNTGTNICANPTIAASPAGGFTVAWGEKDAVVKNNSWDICSRTYSSGGAGSAVQRVNTQLYGDQIRPRVATLASRYLVVWTSLAQDGSFEGAYGQFLNTTGSLAGGEFRINTTTAGKQIHPTVAGNGAGRFMVVWSSFVGGVNSFDLLAQRYVDESLPLLPPDAPFVSALSSTRLGVTWPQVAGFNVAHYELYADGSPTAVVSTSNMWVNTAGYAPNSTHSFRLAYVLTDGRSSPLSTNATGTTWGFDENFDGLPDDWQALYWGGNEANWPSPNADSDGDRVSNRNEFLAGTDPTDPKSVLRTHLDATAQGLFLRWNTQPGFMYQVQVSTNFSGWANLGGPRFALGILDSLNVGGGNGAYYRIVRLR